MLRRDLLTAEIQKLAQALARIMGLKQEEKLNEAEDGLDKILEQDFGILFSDLMASDPDDFTKFLADKDFSSEKLDLFSQFLYLRFDPSVQTDQGRSLAEKLKLIYLLLESKHRVINMINLNRQKIIAQYLKY